MYGLGNWPAVAEHVGVKSQEAVKRHYRQIYLLSKDFPAPQPAPEMANVRLPLAVIHVAQPHMKQQV